MYITKKELAVELSLSIVKIDRMMKQGLPFVKIDKLVRFDFSNVDMWIKQNYKKGGGMIEPRT